MPDRSRLMKLIVDTIQKTIVKDNIDYTIKRYEDLCESLINIFDDNNHFREIISGIIFGHNSNHGGSVSFGISKITDLYAPTK